MLLDYSKYLNKCTEPQSGDVLTVTLGIQGIPDRIAHDVEGQNQDDERDSRDKEIRGISPVIAN